MSQYILQPVFESSDLNDHAESLKPNFLSVPEPPMGNKCALIKDRGIYVLEPGPSSLRSMACTHAGSGGVVIYDGVPDAQGHFQDSDAKAPEYLHDDFYDHWIEDRFDKPDSGLAQLPPNEQYQALLKMAKKEYSIWYESRNGRPIYYAHPACMGMWMLDAGCRHGITVHNLGSDQGSSPIITLTWMAMKTKKV